MLKCWRQLTVTFVAESTDVEGTDVEGTDVDGSDVDGTDVVGTFSIVKLTSMKGLSKLLEYDEFLSESDLESCEMVTVTFPKIKHGQYKRMVRK